MDYSNKVKSCYLIYSNKKVTGIYSTNPVTDPTVFNDIYPETISLQTSKI